MRALLVISALLLGATSAFAADRPVSADEKPKLEAAVKAQGCAGGKMEFDLDDKKFEVDKAVCADGKKYDLNFDANYKLISKNLDKD